MSPLNRFSGSSIYCHYSQTLTNEPKACAISLWYLGAANTTLAEQVIKLETNT